MLVDPTPAFKNIFHEVAWLHLSSAGRFLLFKWCGSTDIASLEEKSVVYYVAGTPMHSFICAHHLSVNQKLGKPRAANSFTDLSLSQNAGALHASAVRADTN